MVKRLLAVPAAAAMVIALAVPVAAAQPSMSTDSLVIQDTVDCGGGLTFDLHLEGRYAITDFGGALKVIAGVAGSASGSNGAVVRFEHHWTETYDLVAGTVTATGTGYNSWAVATGVQARDHGRVVVDLADGTFIFAAGAFELLSSGVDPVALTCQMLDEAA